MRRIARKNPNTKQLWEDIYTGHIDQKKIRSDGDHLQKFIPLFDKADEVLDFGGGMGGNLKYLSERTNNTRYILVDHSEVSLDFVKNQLLGEKDERHNSFEYHPSLEKIPDGSISLVMSIQVLEHITEYKQFMDQLWAKTKPGGIMMISVPVRGMRDRNRQHVNKFTVNSMFRILNTYAEIVHIAPRSFSKRTGKPTTAYFYVEKPETET
jgi:cyclopropane fatty-acyl-phospholipid synthase-like methyltransferase